MADRLNPLPPYALAFSKILSSYLAERNISVDDFARFLSVDDTTLRRWLSGLSCPRRPQLRRICELLALDPDKILSNSIAAELSRGIISFDFLHKHCAENFTSDPLQARYYAVQAAGIVYRDLLIFGHNPTLSVTPEKAIFVVCPRRNPNMAHEARVEFFAHKDGVRAQLFLFYQPRIAEVYPGTTLLTDRIVRDISDQIVLYMNQPMSVIAVKPV